MMITVTLSISAWWLLAAGPICAQTPLIVVALLTCAIRVIVACSCAAICYCCVCTVQVSTDKWAFTFWISIAVTFTLFAKVEATEIDNSLIGNEKSRASCTPITMEHYKQLVAGWCKLWWESCATVPLNEQVVECQCNETHFCTHFSTSKEVTSPPSFNST